MKYELNNSPGNGRINVALHKTGYGNVCMRNGATYWDWYLSNELLGKMSDCLTCFEELMSWSKTQQLITLKTATPSFLL